MKKAKIILASLGLLAITGGTFALKVNKNYNGSLRCTTATAPTNNCPLVTYTFTTVGPLLRCTNVGQPAGTPCELVRAVFNQ